MNRTLESIFKDIDVLGVTGGYDVEQLITPQDCRLLKGTIIDLQQRIDKAIEVINEMISKGYIVKNGECNTYYSLTGYKSEFGIRAPIILNILKGSDSNE